MKIHHCKVFPGESHFNSIMPESGAKTLRSDISYKTPSGRGETKSQIQEAQHQGKRLLVDRVAGPFQEANTHLRAKERPTKASGPAQEPNQSRSTPCIGNYNTASIRSLIAASTLYVKTGPCPLRIATKEINADEYTFSSPDLTPKKRILCRHHKSSHLSPFSCSRNKDLLV
ncbi:hypothetical protein CHS0354_027240 [Potamilus streckersoni]|uniref:Uncharacterized protein n=1 Tax=Potamilus streckersoni TaxID=2493646 RepID=A0AAE0SHS5_9BIVA|nr:hypothetical protein CHS0354_027240 [Potamilus streckersoni]